MDCVDARWLLFQPLGAGAEGFKKTSRGSFGCLAPSSWSEALPLSVVKEEKKKKKPNQEVKSPAPVCQKARLWPGWDS